MEQWQGLPSEIKQSYAVVRVIKQTAEKELVLLQNKADGTRVLLRNYPGQLSAVYDLLAGKTLEHIPRILAAEQRENGYYVLEEFIEGKTLSGVLSTAEILQVLQQLCAALSALHALGVVHRDIKPDHLLRGEDGSIYLLDLDAARIYKNHVEKDTYTLGTTGFAAPEQFGIVQTDHRADLFALGVTLNVLATGYHPSQRLCRGPLRRIILKCTRIDPKARYQTAGAVWRAAVPLRVLGWQIPVHTKRVLLAGAGATGLCVCCILCVSSLFRQPSAEDLLLGSSPAESFTGSSVVPDAENSSSAVDTSSSSSKSSWLEKLLGWGHSADDTENSDQNSSSAPSSNAEPSTDAGDQSGASSSSSSGTGSSSSKPSSSSSSKPSSSSSSKPDSSSSKPDSSSSKPDSSSSKPSSSSSSTSSSTPSPQEEEIRAAIEEYNALNSEYQRLGQLHAESYERYQALYGYQLKEIEARRDLALHEASLARDAAAEAQARADAYGAEDPPNLEAQAQAQAEADSYTQLAAQKSAEVDAMNTEWSALYNRPEVQQAHQEFTNYAVQGTALRGQVTALRDRINYLQKLYGIYLM